MQYFIHITSFNPHSIAVGCTLYLNRPQKRRMTEIKFLVQAEEPRFKPSSDSQIPEMIPTNQWF